MNNGVPNSKCVSSPGLISLKNFVNSNLARTPIAAISPPAEDSLARRARTGVIQIPVALTANSQRALSFKSPLNVTKPA